MRGKERKGSPSLSQEWNVQRWKGWEGEKVRILEGERKGGHTTTHEIIVEYREYVWSSSCHIQ